LFVLQTVSRARLAAVADTPQFREIVADLVREKREALDAPTWFRATFPDAPFGVVAYFSMEFMLSEALPIYSGGLNNQRDAVLSGNASTTCCAVQAAVGCSVTLK